MAPLTDAGQGEGLKASTHALLGALGLICATYNTLAWLDRKEGHLATNVVVYSSLTFWEAYQVVRHWSRPQQDATGATRSAYTKVQQAALA